MLGSHEINVFIGKKNEKMAEYSNFIWFNLIQGFSTERIRNLSQTDLNVRLLYITNSIKPVSKK